MKKRVGHRKSRHSCFPPPSDESIGFKHFRALICMAEVFVAQLTAELSKVALMLSMLDRVSPFSRALGKCWKLSHTTACRAGQRLVFVAGD